MEPHPDRILVVEDEPLVRKSLLFALASLGASVVGASTPDEALAILRSQRFSHALVDYHLGQGATGADLLAELRRAQPACRRILMSGAVETFESGLEAGLAHALLRKPFTRDQIAAVLQLVAPAPP